MNEIIFLKISNYELVENNTYYVKYPCDGIIVKRNLLFEKYTKSYDRYAYFRDTELYIMM